MRMLTKKYKFLASVLMFTLASSYTISLAQENDSVNQSSSLSARANAAYPVKWYQGFDLQSYLKGERPAKTIEDIKRQLQSKWEYPVKVYSEDDSVTRKVQSCEDFYNAKKDKLYPQSNVERGPYSFAGLYCYAAQLILDGRPAIKTYIENLKLDENIAKYLPADVEYRVNPASPRHKSGSWADVEKVKAVKVTDGEVEYSSKGANHSVKKIAVGDFNGDGVQDILLLITHSVKQGTHFENHLYLLTRFGQNDILKTIKRYNALED